MKDSTPSLFDLPACGPSHHNKKPRDTKEPDPIPNARWIPLTKGRFALVDESDFECVAGRNWSVHPTKCTDYAVSGTGLKGRRIYLHRFLLDAPDGMEVDHVDGNGLDCRRANLRICTSGQNRCNMRNIRPNKTSVYKGVCWDKTRGKWRATTKLNRQWRTLGRFDSEEDAARASDAAARELFGEFARLNFPVGAKG